MNGEGCGECPYHEYRDALVRIKEALEEGRNWVPPGEWESYEIEKIIGELDI